MSVRRSLSKAYGLLLEFTSVDFDTYPRNLASGSMRAPCIFKTSINA
jgi:hypothetical protein